MKSVLFFTLLFPFCISVENRPEVDTVLGKVQGTYKISFGARTFAAFEGIPYAKPPIGKLRFQEPQEIEPWPGIWQATNLYTCIQNGLNFDKKGTVHGEEDCLYLNIYTPRENPTPNDTLDVVVHIHGGGFMAGSGHFFTKPDYIMDRDLVFVTLNYRLGPLGFLSTEDDVVVGNNGLKDQVLALQWIQTNIRSFGGNPKSVTLDGFSAGGASVHYHYLSPISEGLFHRGFSHSGTALNVWALQDAPLEKAKRLAASVGCLNDSSSEFIVACLKEKPAQQIVQKNYIFNAIKGFPFAPFGPIVEKKVYNAFLPNDPQELLLSGQINDVPWINLYTAQEAAITVAAFANEIDSLDDNWEEWVHHIMGSNYSVSVNQKVKVANKIREYYFGKEKLASNIQTLVKLFTDALNFDSTKASQLHAKVATSSVYNILFNYKGSFTLTSEFVKTDLDFGVGHGDDILYLFATNPNATLSKSDENIKDMLLDLLFSYANSGIPKINELKQKWDPVPSDGFAYVEINAPDNIVLRKNVPLSNDAMQFWESLHLRRNLRSVNAKDEL